MKNVWKKCSITGILTGLILVCLTACSPGGEAKEDTADSAGKGQMEEQSSPAEPFSLETLAKELEAGILEGKEEIHCVFEGEAEELNEEALQGLQACLADSYLCGNLLSGVDMQWEQKGKNAEGTFSIRYHEDVNPPVVCVSDREMVLDELLKGWQEGREKVTFVFENLSCTEEEMFAILDTAEMNSAFLPCEADSVYYEAFDPNGNRQIVRMWLEFAAGTEDLPGRQQELKDQVALMAEEIRGTGDKGEEQLYRDVYQKLLDTAEYDDSIAYVTDAQRLSTDMRILRSAYGALVDGHTVCTGYARGYKALCDELGLPCWVISGTRQGVRHSWNLIRIGEEMFYVDCTAGDTGSSEEEAFLFREEQLGELGYIVDTTFIVPKI